MIIDTGITYKTTIANNIVNRLKLKFKKNTRITLPQTKTSLKKRQVGVSFSPCPFILNRLKDRAIYILRNRICYNMCASKYFKNILVVSVSAYFIKLLWNKVVYVLVKRLYLSNYFFLLFTANDYNGSENFT